MDTERLVENELPHISKRVSIIFTISLYAGYLVFGIGSSLSAPALLDIAEIVASDFKTVSYGVMVRSIGYGLGGVLLSLIYKKINRQDGMVACMFLCSACLLAIPFTRDSLLFIAMEGIYGFFTGGVDCGSNAWIMELWPTNSSPFMQALHFFFALGMVIAPLIDEPFLKPLGENRTVSTENSDEKTKANVMIPFIIGFAGFFLVSIFQLVLRFMIRYQAKDVKNGDTCDTEKNKNKPPKEVKSKKYKILTIGLGMLLYIAYAATEMNTMTFISEYAVYCDLKLSKSTGAFMSSMTAASFALFRGVNSFIATKMTPQTLIYGSMFVMLCGNLMLILWAKTSLIGLWIAIFLLGAGHSAPIGAFYSFLQERIQMTTIICGFCMFSCCVGSIVSPLVVGSFLKSHPSVFGYLNAGSLAFCLLLLTLFRLIDRFSEIKDREVNEETQQK